MKKVLNYFLFAFFIVSIVSCASSEKKTQEKEHHADAVKPTASTGNFGEAISEENAVPASEIPALLAENETVNTKLTGNIESVCQMTGCWVDLDLENGETLHVTFKDDAFLLPKDAAGKVAVIEGTAQRQELSVDYLKHLAADEGKTQEEIDAITEPSMEYTFVAAGVIIK
jgi:hypothetical protein